MIFKLPNPITSRNGPFKISPMIGRFRKVCLLLFYVLLTSKIIAECVWFSAYLWWLYSAALLRLRNQAATNISWYPTQSHYLDTGLTSPCPNLIMLSTWLGTDKYQFLSHCFDLTRFRTRQVQIHRSPKMGHKDSQGLIGPSCLVFREIFFLVYNIVYIIYIYIYIYLAAE